MGLVVITSPIVIAQIAILIRSNGLAVCFDTIEPIPSQSHLSTRSDAIYQIYAMRIQSEQHEWVRLSNSSFTKPSLAEFRRPEYT